MHCLLFCYFVLIHISLPTQIILDQPFVMDVNVRWESELEYYIAHGDWKRVSVLLDQIPKRCLGTGNIQISVDSLQPVRSNVESSKNGKYLCAFEELDSVCIEVPDIQMLNLPSNIMGSIWLKMNMEEKLAKKLVFSKEYWEGTEEIVPLLARAGSISGSYTTFVNDDSVDSFPHVNSSDGGEFNTNAVHAIHRLLVHHCVQYNLPYLLDLYLDQHMVIPDNGSLSSLVDAAVSGHV